MAPLVLLRNYLALDLTCFFNVVGMLFETGGICKGLIAVTFVMFFRLRRTWKGGQSL